MRLAGRSKESNINGIQVGGGRRTVRAGELVHKHRIVSDDEPQGEVKGGLDGTAMLSGPAHREVNHADLVRKLAWAVGSSIGIPYGRQSALHERCEELVPKLLEDIGLGGP